LKQENLREKYIRKLGELFHHKNATNLAELLFKERARYSNLIYDYIAMVCVGKFQQQFEEEVSRLEEKSTKLT